MKLLFATGNDKKFELMKDRLKELQEVELIMPKHVNVKINIKEDGRTPAENAIKKARAYHEATKLATIAEDSGLWIEKFLDEDQPGLFVKRVNGREDLSDDEILNCYIQKLNKVGGKSNARYITGIAVINQKGEVFSKTIEEEIFILTSNINEKGYTLGGFLDVISYDPINNKYFNELTQEEKSKRYKVIDKEIRNMVQEILKQ